MLRTAILAVAALAFLAGAAHGQPDPFRLNSPQQEQFLRQLGKDFPPTTLFSPAPAYPTSKPDLRIIPTTPPLTVVQYDAGGNIAQYSARWQSIAAQGGPVKVVGACYSACTLVVAFIRKDKLCFGAEGDLYFHAARTPDGNPAPDSTEWMINSYPDDIRGWLVAHGGRNKMPMYDLWKLPARQLWEMGYKNCNN